MCVWSLLLLISKWARRAYEALSLCLQITPFILYYAKIITFFLLNWPMSSASKWQERTLCTSTHAVSTQSQTTIFFYRGLLSARPNSQPFLGCWTSTLIICPLLKDSKVGLEPTGWWATRAFMTRPPPPPPPPAESAPKRKMLPCGDGAGGMTNETRRYEENSLLSW